MRRLRLTLISAAALAAAAIAPASASAVNETIGSALLNGYQGGVCNNFCLSTQSAATTIVNPLVAGGNGTVTEWKVRTGDPDALYHLIILRPSGTPAGYIAVTRTTAPSAVPPGTTDSILTYPGNGIKIRDGDHIGVYQTGNADIGLPQITTGGFPGNVIDNFFTGNTLLDGLGATFIPDGQHELLLQATLDICKVPDVAGQKTTDAEAALQAAGCTPVIVKKKAKRKKVGKVLTQDPAVGGGAVDGSKTVTLTVGKKKKKQKKK